MKNKDDFFGPNYSAEDISSGDLVPVGGQIHNDELYLKMAADTDSFGEFFEKAIIAYEKLDRAGLAEWLTQLGVSDRIDTDQFAAMFVFQRVLNKTYPDISANRDQRKSMYSKDGPAPKLSDIVEKGAAECAEIALLAHSFLNRLGISNQYMCGAFLAKPAYDFSEAHSYIVIPTETSFVIFDPANPTDTNQGFMPSIHVTDKKTFMHWSERAKKQMNAFMIIENILSSKERGFGTSNQTNIIPERDFTNREHTQRSRNTKQAAPKSNR